MRCVIQSAAGYYSQRKLKPTWVESMHEAKVFPNMRIAERVVRVLAYNKIRAWVVPVDAKNCGN